MSEQPRSRRIVPRASTLAVVASLSALVAAGLIKSDIFKAVVSASAAIVVVAALINTFRSIDFASTERINNTPEQLAWIRIVVCLAAFVLTIIDHLPAIARIPLEFQNSVGFFSLLRDFPGYATLVSNPSLLAALQWSTASLLFLSMLGLRPRVTLLVGALGFFLMQAILRHYTYFFHSGLILVYLLFVLAFTPCAAAWSLDRRLGLSKSEPSQQAVAFSIYACFIVVAIVYLFCGLSKMRDSGLVWFNGENLRYKFLQDAMNPVFLDCPWKPTLWLFRHHATEFIYSFIGIAGVAVELGYFTVLFSRTARVVMPIMAFGVHAGILFFQHILFFDFLVLQFIFLDARRLYEFVSRNPRAAQDVDLPRRALPFIAVATIAVMIAGSFLVWTYRVTYYPASDWHMYSKVSPKAPIVYLRFIANLEDGRAVSVAHRDYCIARMPNHVSTLAKAFRKPWALGSFDQFLSAYVAERNRNLAFGSPIRSIEIQKWRWNYMVDPDDPRFGWIADIHVFDAAIPR